MVRKDRPSQRYKDNALICVHHLSGCTKTAKAPEYTFQSRRGILILCRSLTPVSTKYRVPCVSPSQSPSIQFSWWTDRKILNNWVPQQQSESLTIHSGHLAILYILGITQHVRGQRYTENTYSRNHRISGSSSQAPGHVYSEDASLE